MARSYKDEPGIRLLRAVTRTQRILVGRHRWIEKEGVSISEFDVLATVGNTDGLSMSEIAARMVTTPQNVTRVAAALEKKGLAVRARDEASARVVILRLTAKGERLFERLYPRAAEYTIGVLDEALSRRDQERLRRLLDRLGDALLEEDE